MLEGPLFLGLDDMVQRCGVDSTLGFGPGKVKIPVVFDVVIRNIKKTGRLIRMALI